MNKRSKHDKNRKSAENGIVKEVQWQWSEHLTELDLSNKEISNFGEKVKFPAKLRDLNLSNNKLVEFPGAVLNLTDVVRLDVSYNKIRYFDCTPKFCHVIEELNLSNNDLCGPPCWIWTESPAKLEILNLSCNTHLVYALEDYDYFIKLLDHKTQVSEVILFNCRLGSYRALLGTFINAKTLDIGISDDTICYCNELYEVPCNGLDQCCQVEKLNLSNTQICTIEQNIDVFTNLVEINLSYNNICSLPRQFCNLINLEVCILSVNKISYLPEEMAQLKKLVSLQIDSNQLYTLPEDIFTLPNLRRLDVYDNNLYEYPDDWLMLAELDLAQNYLEEPNDVGYLEKKERLRLNTHDREDGSKVEEEHPPDTGHSSETTDDEELIEYLNNQDKLGLSGQCQKNEPASSPEDWDSDEYWVPFYFKYNRPTESPWLSYVRQKMNEGNFCPMDLHTVSITEKVRYEKKCYPNPPVIVKGQFDDISEDDS